MHKHKADRFKHQAHDPMQAPRPISWRLSLAIGAGLLVCFSGKAQWTTSDDFILQSPYGAAGWALATNSTSGIVSVGTAANGTATSLTVARASGNLDSSWLTCSTFSYSNAATLLRNITSSGRMLYAAANYKSGSWLVLRSADGGTNWMASDALADSNSLCWGVAADASGNVYATGYGSGPAGPHCWTIRKLDSSTAQWSTLLQGPPGTCEYIVVHPSDGIFACGTVPYNGVSTWAVLQSPDYGMTWNQVDLYPGSGIAPNSVANSIAVDNAGNLYAVGWANSPGTAYWVVRSSTDAGQTWNTIDTFVLPSGNRAWASSATSDYLGNVYVAGVGFDSISSHWIVRMLPVGGSSWQTSDDYQMSPGLGAGPSGSASGIVSANSGQLLMVTGGATDVSGVGHWITRKLAVSSPNATNAPQLTITPAGASIVLSWPTNGVGFTLFSSTNLGMPVTWTAVSPGPSIVDSLYMLTIPMVGTSQFFRLAQ